ncbi:MAG: helix-turn-helix transcriptional regulator [Hornefia butyriciproducens]|uniref:helix-turn-helix transcriptional regulator n=1 Tax=Hornefia butyriciproducens TaxID=2652293 RepID=UPI002A758E02|nr:helix-turn-helix transcriptional regulator [Hornefia butyriciproducens]MDY2991746.1 helix-turn-helix transcriptional regulator [Hornefia butyriciproducens]
MIGDNIKRLRERYHLTQSELGKIAGVSDKAVSTWENGIADPRMGAIQRLADHFGISKADLVDDEPPSGSSLTDGEQQIVSSFRQLNEEGRERLLNYADDLVASGKYIKNNEDALVEGA